MGSLSRLSRSLLVSVNPAKDGVNLAIDSGDETLPTGVVRLH